MTRSTGRRRVTFGVFLVASQIAWSAAFAQERDEGWLDDLSGWFQPSSSAAGAFRPADQTVQDLIAELVLVREAVGVYDTPAEAELHQERRPIHVYAKALEVLSKVIEVQRRFGVPLAEPGRIPLEEIGWPAVTARILYVVDELRKIKEPLDIDGRIKPATAASASTAAELYQSLGYASSLLDGLLGRPLTTDDVQRNCTSVLGELELVAAALGVSLDLEVPAVDQVVGWKDVAGRLVLALSRVIDLQKRLGMDASGMPSLTMVRVTPAEVFDASGTLLAEIVRVKIHFGIETLRRDRPETIGTTVTDTFAATLVIIEALDAMTAAIEV